MVYGTGRVFEGGFIQYEGAAGEIVLKRSSGTKKVETKERLPSQGGRY